MGDKQLASPLPTLQSSTTSPTATVTSTTALPPPTIPRAEADSALAFFRATESDCTAHANRVGNEPVPSSFFSGAVTEGPAPGGGRLIRDGAGNRLVVRVDEHVVYDAAGREAVLPHEYSFGCPETLYLGSAAD